MSIYEDYNFGYNTDIYDNVGSNIFASLAAYSVVASIISIGVSVIIIVALFKIFKRFGKPGWYSLIPFLNMWTLFEIVGLHGWLSLIPFANMICMYIALYKLAKKCGKGTGFAICTIFFAIICLPILAFSKDNNSDNNSDQTPVSTNTENNLDNNTFSNRHIKLILIIS